ncbi:MAG: zinc ribbon domain-containing protein, partial [Gammaproteobacteria bacterium]|nr:zinc ribbon domain-containing protein [Gammaproteobacteria bacterium]
GRVVEVRHKMDQLLRTWGDVCALAGIDAAGADPRAPVEKLISAGYIGAGSSAAREPACEAPSCGTGGCGAGMCGLQ